MNHDEVDSGTAVASYASLHLPDLVQPAGMTLVELIAARGVQQGKLSVVFERAIVAVNSHRRRNVSRKALDGIAMEGYDAHSVVRFAVWLVAVLRCRCGRFGTGQRGRMPEDGQKNHHDNHHYLFVGLDNIPNSILRVRFPHFCMVILLDFRQLALF